jgi:hypothetical protein
MGLLDNISNVQNVVGSVSNAANFFTGGGLQDSLLSGTGLTAGAEAIGDVVGAFASFGDDSANANDWRVRLSMAKWTSFQGSPVFKPLKDAGGLIFPYTPEITISSSAKYSQIPVTHTNYMFHAFQNSDPGEISITAAMNVEDSTQGLYWIAAVHYLRSLTKMFTGSDPKAGNPPPIVFLNGYGNYVFKNVPVVVTSFSCTLGADTDYIGVNVVGSAAGEIQGVTGALGGLAGQVGGLFGGDSAVGGAASMISGLAGGVGQIAGLAGSLGLGGSVSGGVSHVPAKSSFSVKLMPMYSRNSTRNFSLDRFVQGGYLNNPFGYI